MVRKSLPILLIIALVFIGCGKNVSDWTVYTTASNQFVVLAEQYETYYQLQDDATKAKWKEKFDPIFDKGDRALDSWRLMLNAGEDTMEQQSAFMQIKSEIIKTLYKLIKED